MPKSRNKRKNGRRKLSGYVIQTVNAINGEKRKELLKALDEIDKKTPKTKQFKASALDVQRNHKSSTEIKKKLNKKVHIVQRTN